MTDKDNKTDLTTADSQENLIPAELSEDQRLKLKQTLNNESSALLNELSTTSDIEKTRDLTYLFNINNSKKAMVRQDSLNDVMDELVDCFKDRVVNHRDEFDNDTLIKGMSTIQGIMDKNTTIAKADPEPTNLIQINKTETNITVSTDDSKPQLTIQQRKDIDAVLSKVMKKIIDTDNAESKVIDAEIVETKEPTDE